MLRGALTEIERKRSSAGRYWTKIVGYCILPRLHAVPLPCGSRRKAAMRSRRCSTSRCTARRGPVTLADIAARQGISQSYLEQLFGKLKRARLVQSLRGPGGGYALTRRAGEHQHLADHRRGRRRHRCDALRWQRRLSGRARSASRTICGWTCRDGSTTSCPRSPWVRCSSAAKCRRSRGARTRWRIANAERRPALIDARVLN